MAASGGARAPPFSPLLAPSAGDMALISEGDFTLLETRVDELTRSFGRADLEATVAQLNALLALLPTLDLEPFAYFQAQLPSMLAPCPRPYAFVLALVAHPAMKRKAGDRIDLLALLVRALAECADPDASLGSGADDDDDKDAGGGAPAKDSLTPELTARATEICKSGSVTPKVFECLHHVYHVTLEEAELVKYGKQLVQQQAGREAADFITRFKMQAHFTHEEILLPLIKQRLFDAVIRYVETPKDPAAAAYVVEHVAERREGDDPNLAIKLIQRFGLRNTDFPRVVYLKKKDCVWWAVRSGKVDEFAEFMCNGHGHYDIQLQVYLCKQLLKSKRPKDIQDCLKYLLQYDLLGEEECKEMPAQCEAALKARADADAGLAPVAVAPPSPVVAAADAPVKSAKDERKEARDLVKKEDKEKKRRAGRSQRQKEEAEDDAETDALELLTVADDHVVFVNDEKTMARAKAQLIEQKVDMVGVDLEHIPENFFGVHSLPTTCQLMQVATRTTVFLFDLQAIVLPGVPGAPPVAGPVAAAAAATASAATTTLPAAPVPLSPQSSTEGVASSGPFSYPRAFDDLITALFDADQILKIGMGFEQDWSKLRHEFPSLVCFQIPINHYYDLKVLTEDFPPALLSPVLVTLAASAAAAGAAVDTEPPSPLVVPAVASSSSPSSAPSSSLPVLTLASVAGGTSSGRAAAHKSPTLRPMSSPTTPDAAATAKKGDSRRSSRDDSSSSSSNGGGGKPRSGSSASPSAGARRVSPAAKDEPKKEEPSTAAVAAGAAGGEAPKGEIRERRCYKCGEPGHYSNSPLCPKRDQPPAPGAPGAPKESRRASREAKDGAASGGGGGGGGGGRSSRSGSREDASGRPRTGSASKDRKEEKKKGGKGMVAIKSRGGGGGGGGGSASDDESASAAAAAAGSNRRREALEEIDDINEEAEEGQGHLLRKRWIADGSNGARKKEGGLARLVRLVLAQKLDKSAQISHWGRRPLTAVQVQYAAADARCQIAIVDRMRALKFKIKPTTITQ